MLAHFFFFSLEELASYDLELFLFFLVFLEVSDAVFVAAIPGSLCL